MIPGEYFLASEEIEINAGRETCRLIVSNRGDRPIQVGSHCHFFEVNRWLAFDRPQAYGMRLNIAAGTAVRFEPGDTREVELVALGGGALACFALLGFAARGADQTGFAERDLEEGAAVFAADDLDFRRGVVAAGGSGAAGEGAEFLADGLGVGFLERTSD